MQELLQLPIQIQATLVAGYLGYALLKRDYRKTEKITDMWLLILLLGLPKAVTLQLCDSSWAYLSVFFGLPLAYGWLKFAEAKWTNLLYRKKISHTLNSGDTWKTLSAHKDVAATQIKLVHKNGNQYLCNSTMEFFGEAFAPFIMDEDGIAFYVTDTKGKDGVEWIEVAQVKLEPEFGSMITYFPRADIEFLEMRYTTQVEQG